VTELVLRGIFTFRQRELDWLYRYGASEVYPDKWEEFLAPIPREERGDLVAAYQRRLTDPDPQTRLTAAKAWSKWEAETVTLMPSPDVIGQHTSDDFAIAIARIENHYMAHRGWLEEGQLLDGAERLRGIPGVIVQGRYDMCTPPSAAWDLHRAWPEARLEIVHGGHLFSEPAVLDGLLRASDSFAERG
jgi:proline iminopeptidase